jgi:hypothetical protein
MKAQGNTSQDMENTKMVTNKGNVAHSNSFSILGNDIIAERSLGMGVFVNNDDLPIIDVLTELEKARQFLNEEGKMISNYQENMENENSVLVDEVNDESE